jgi:hypothetical protein
MPDAQLLTLQSCARAAGSAIKLAVENDLDGADRALGRAEHCLRVLRRKLPPHARRARLAQTAVEKACRAVQAARDSVGDVEWERRVGAAERAAQAALAP